MKATLDPLYVQDFLFKQSNSYQIFDLKTPAYIPTACNLLISDKKRGLLYIGHNDKIIVFKPVEEDKSEWKIELQLPGVISKIAINCDYNYIAICLASKPTVLIYDANSLVRNSLNLLLEITSSNKLDSYITDIRWNPTVPATLCTVTNDCTIGSFQLKIDGEIRENFVPKISMVSKVSNELQALCAAWSPKGKQIAVGCKNGDIVQLKPDTLKIARTISGPSPPIGEVISILWLSNYQFCAAYLNNERQINVLIIDAPKGETKAIFTCYEDITYGFPDAEGEGSVPRYYFEHVPEWGLIIAGSSTSSEIALLGTTDGGAIWNQWQLVDSGRAQLPLIRTTEIYPLGLAVDRSPINRLPWGADSTLPHPVPVLYILGTSGKLCSFHMVNLIPNCPAINVTPTETVAPPTSLQSNVSLPEMSFNMNVTMTSTPRAKPEVALEQSKPAPMTNIFGDSLKAAGFFQPPVEQVTEQPKSQEGKPAPQIIVKPVVPKEPPVSEPVKIETKPIVDKDTSAPQITEQKASIDDNVRIRAYLQEQALFEKELRSRLEPQVWECGTDAEKKRLGETCVDIEQFLRDLKETTNGLSIDIAYLKALLLQSFAWLEETKSKNAASIDITTTNCNENSKIADLQRWYYYIQTQLNQVSKILDLEWSEHKAQQKSKMKIPNLEYIYQNLLTLNKIIAKEKEKVEEIWRRWKSLNRSLAADSVSNLDRSMANLHMSSPKSPTIIRGKTNVIDARCKTIATKTLSFTHKKQLKLRALLTESSPRIIKPVNPSPIQDRLKATLSSLASSSPVINETKIKAEPPIVKQNVNVVKQPIEKQIKSQSPLASLNSIVARIGSSDTNGVTQNKVQQKPLSTTISFPSVTSVKQSDKKPVSAVSQSKSKQDFPTSFGASTTKSQDILFSKSLLVDATIKNNKESMTNDILKAPESILFSTGSLKDALSTDYSLTETTHVGITCNFPTLSVTSAVKPDTVVTLSFATPNMVSSVTKSSSSGNTLDIMSFAYTKSVLHTSTAEPSITVQTVPIQTPIELSALSLGSPGTLTLQSVDHSNSNAKVNATTTTMSFIASVPVITTQTSTTATTVASIMNISGVNVMDANTARKPMTEVPSSSAVVTEKAATSEAKVPFGTATVQSPTSLAATSVFGGQTIAKNAVTTSETLTLPATTTFSTVSFPSITSTFGTSTSTTTSAFSGFANTSPSITSSSASNTMSPFQTSLSKPTFGETATSIPATSFGISSSTSSAGTTISFGMPTTTTTTSITPAFGKSLITSPVSNAQFPGVQTPASTANIFGKPIISPTSTPFGSTSSSVFSNTPATSSNTSMFGGSNINSIFGSTSPSGNIFGGNTGFGTSTTGPIFNTNAPKPGIVFGGSTNAPASPFGATSNTSPATVSGSPAGANVFGSTVSNTSPIQQPVLGGQPAFGQAPAFGSKPVFGSSPIFGGAKPIFGGSGFGSPPTFESPNIGFGSPSAGPTMDNMPKVFGEVAGSSTFESLANQSDGLSFGSLAQKNPEQEKPTFTAGSSFSSWR